MNSEVLPCPGCPVTTLASSLVSVGEFARCRTADARNRGDTRPDSIGAGTDHAPGNFAGHWTESATRSASGRAISSALESLVRTVLTFRKTLRAAESQPRAARSQHAACHAGANQTESPCTKSRRARRYEGREI